MRHTFPHQFLTPLSEQAPEFAQKVALDVNGHCGAPALLGNGDGAWTVCVDHPPLLRKLEFGACVAISVGIRDDYSYDEGKSKAKEKGEKGK